MVVAGGTGFSSYQTGDLLYASNTSTFSKLNIGVNGKVLKVLTGALTWGDDQDNNIGNSNLTLLGTRAITMNGNTLTFDGNTGDVVFNDNGNVNIGGSLVVSGAITGVTSYNGLVVPPNTGVITTGTWNGTTIAIANGGTGTTNGSIVGTGALSFTSNGISTLTLDSGTTGAIDIGTGSNAKIITIGNTISTTALNLQSGTGNIGLQVAGTSTTGNVQIGLGDGGTATPDLLVMDIKTTSGDPTGTNGAMYYNSSTGKFRCFENSAWTNCITASSSGSDLQHATSYSYNTDVGIINIPTGGAQIILGTVSVTPLNASGDVYVTGWADVLSGNNIDQPLQVVIETTSNCAGSVVGNASTTYVITPAGGNDGYRSLSGAFTPRIPGQ